MLKELKRYNLDHERTIEYFNFILEGGNTLSKELERVLDFEKGQFFTLLPDNADFSALYEFPGGWILPQNPTYDQCNEFGRKTGSYTWIPTLNKEIGAFIFDTMEKNNYVSVFEDVITRPGKSHLESIDKYGALYLSEYYCYLTPKNASPEIIVSVIRESGIIWHTLFILTEINNPENINKEITLENIKEFSENTKLLVLGAYDGEGYVFWEPLAKDSQISTIETPISKST